MRLISIIVISIITPGSICFAGASAEAIEFLRTKMSEIRGEVALGAPQAEFPAPKCGTPVTVAINLLRKQTGDLALEALVSRPDYLPDTLGGPHVLIHYVSTGVHAPYNVTEDIDPADGIPDYINRVEEAFEYVWDYETVTLGYNTPLTDFGRGGDDRYDIYVENLGAGFYGFTNPEDLLDQYRANSFVEIENDFAGSRYATHPLDGMHVTAAHEFFHAVQFAYDALEYDFGNVNDPNSYRPWWLEASATWMEDIVYDNVNDYLGYLPFFLGYSWMGLGSFSYNYGDARSYHPYGACLWPIYFTEKYGVDLVRQIWEICGQVGGYNTLPATESVLRSYSSSLAGGFTEFTVWNFHTADFADPAHFYSEGASFPTSVDTSGYIGNLYYNQVPLNYLINPPEHLAANYIVIKTRPEAGGVVVNFNGQDLANAEWHTALLGYWPGESVWHDMGVDPSTGDGADEWRDWDSFEYIVVIPAVSGTIPIYGNSAYAYDGWVAFDPTLVGNPDLSGGFKLISAYPSPFVIYGNTRLSMSYSLDKRYSRDRIGIRVYDASGAMVMKLPENAMAFTSPGRHEGGIVWDGRNSDGENVASGIYIIHMEAEDKSSHIKIAVINGTR